MKHTPTYQTIYVNGVCYNKISNTTLSYKDILIFAQKESSDLPYSITYSSNEENGMLKPGERVRVIFGMNFSVYLTVNT